jgi:hypothetical protein
MRPRRMIDAVAAASSCSSLEADDLTDEARIVEQVDPPRVDCRKQVAVKVALGFRGGLVTTAGSVSELLTTILSAKVLCDGAAENPSEHRIAQGE